MSTTTFLLLDHATEDSPSVAYTNKTARDWVASSEENSHSGISERSCFIYEMNTHALCPLNNLAGSLSSKIT